MGDLVSVDKRKPRLLDEVLGADGGRALAECGGEGERVESREVGVVAAEECFERDDVLAAISALQMWLAASKLSRSGRYR